MAITAARWQVVDRIGLNQAITDTSTTQQHDAGEIVLCKDTSSANRGRAHFMYAKGVASVAAGDVCVISPNNDAAIRGVARGIGQVGFAMAAIVASNWGWFQVSGVAVANVLASFADDKAVYLTSTAGSVDDAVVTGDLIYGCRSSSAIDTGQATLDLRFPFVGDTDNA